MQADKQVFEEMDRQLMESPHPSRYFNSLGGETLRTRPFNMLAYLKDTRQSPQHHPEGNVWNHTMLVLDEAAARKSDSTDPRAFMWAALLHDLGKPGTTRLRGGKLTSYDHDRLGERLAIQFLRHFGQPEDFIERVAALVRFHMHILYVGRSLPFADMPGLRRRTELSDVALLGLCDRLGRGGADPHAEEENVRLFLEKTGAPDGE